MNLELEKRVKEKSNCRCAMCHKITEKCYILDNTKKETEDNIIMLCQMCSEKYIGNLELIKQIKQKRNYWYKQVKESIEKIGNIDNLIGIQPEDDDSAIVVIYHIVYENEGFEETAQTIFRLLSSTKENSLGRKRNLYLDIEGHVDENGIFDDEMQELQKEFILGTIFPYFSELHIPLLTVRNIEGQKEDIPDELDIFSKEQDVIKFVKNNIRGRGYILEKVGKSYEQKEKKIIYMRDKKKLHNT